MTQELSVLTGATAGATEAIVVVPFELVKIRLQDKAQAGRYRGAADAVVKIVQQEGPLALYNGLEATLWRYLLPALVAGRCGDAADTFGGMRDTLGASTPSVHSCPRRLPSKENSEITLLPALSVVRLEQ